MRYELGWACVLQDVRGPRGLDVAARMHGHGGDAAALDPIGEHVDEAAFVLSVEQRAEILLKLLARGAGLLAGPAGLGARGEFDAVGREPVAHQARARPLRVCEAVEYRQ